MQSELSAINVSKQLLTNNLLKQNLPDKTVLFKPAADKVSIGILSPEKTQALLNREIADKLEKYFQGEGIELKGLNAADYTPEKVSERILGFVSGRILSEGDNDKQNELMAQARKGIEKGFAEARDILESLSVLNGQVKEDINTTYDLLQQGLDRLEQGINNTQNQGGDRDQENDSDTENDTDDDASPKVQQVSLQSRYSRDEQTRVEITTNDGDKILIDLFKQQSAQSNQSMSQAENGSIYTRSSSLSASTGISYQVQGELDSGEQKAIDELLNNVAKVSEQFFSGNVQEAFKQAIKLDFNSEELTRFSLDMGYQETRSVAISTYNDYQTQPIAKNSAQPIEAASLKDMNEYIKQMDQLFKAPLATEMFADPGKSIADLITGMNKMLFSDEMKQLEQASTTLLDSLVEQLKARNSLPEESVAKSSEAEISSL